MPDSGGVPSSLADAVHAIATHYGIPSGDVSPAPRQGQVNLTVYLGQDLVLRIPRKRAYEDRLAKEAAVIPVAQRAGVPTAGVVSFDPSRRIVDVSYILLERLRGPTLGEFGYDPEASVRAHTSLAEILALLHEVRMKDVGPIAGMGEPSTFSLERLVGPLCETGELGSAQGRWLLDWFSFLESHGASRSEPVLLHNDVIPSNLIVDRDGRVTAVIDWGSADWGEPARDFVDLPMRALPSIISGYRSAAPPRDFRTDAGDGGMSLEAGALWYQLLWALAKLRREGSTSEQRNWSAPRQARLLEILRFFSATPPSPWPDLVKGSPSGLA